MAEIKLHFEVERTSGVSSREAAEHIADRESLKPKTFWFGDDWLAFPPPADAVPKTEVWMLITHHPPVSAMMTAGERASDLTRRIQGCFSPVIGPDWQEVRDQCEKALVAHEEQIRGQAPASDGTDRTSLMQQACVGVICKRIETMKSYGMTPERKDRLKIYEGIIEEMRAINAEEF